MKGFILISGVGAYLAVVYVFPIMGIAIDVPLLARLGGGLFGVLLGVLVMIVLIAIPIVIFLLASILFGYGFGVGFSSSPVGKALIGLRRPEPFV